MNNIYVAGLISVNQTVDKVMFFEEEQDSIDYMNYLSTKQSINDADWDITIFTPFFNSYPIIKKKEMNIKKMKKEDALSKLSDEEKILLGIV